MKYWVKIFIFFILCSKVLLANEALEQREYLIGFSLMDMNYKEFADSGFLLNREDGILPGITGQVKFPGQSIDSYLYGSYHGATIKYDGYTQGGSPHQTDTREDIIDIQYRISEKETQRTKFYGGLGYRYWRRDIQSRGNVSGILEFYKWFYGLAGVKSRFFKDHNSEWSIDFRVTHMLHAEMDIDFLGFMNYDDKTVNLGKKTNFRIALPWRINVKNSYTWVVEPYFEQWDIGKSNTVNLTVDGAVVTGCPTALDPCGVLEPRSTTRNVGINVQMVVPF